jgi:hypothetical protein
MQKTHPLAPSLGKRGGNFFMRPIYNSRFLLHASDKGIIFTANIYRILLPFSSQEKGPGDEFLKYNLPIMHRTINPILYQAVKDLRR